MSNKQSNLLVIVLIFVIAVATYIAWKAKQTDMIANRYQDYQRQGRVLTSPDLPQQQNVTVEQKLDLLMRQYQNVDSAAQKIWERTKWNSDRMTLLATVNNHNLVVLQKDLPRTELIFINPDWTIDRLPDRIYLDQQDQEFLRRFLSSRASSSTTSGVKSN